MTSKKYNESKELRRYVTFEYNGLLHKEFMAYIDVRMYCANKKIDASLKLSYRHKLYAGMRPELITEFHKRYDAIKLSSARVQYITDLIKGDYGEVSINRCTSCGNIVASKDAKQCLWCHHDWH